MTTVLSNENVMPYDALHIASHTHLAHKRVHRVLVGLWVCVVALNKHDTPGTQHLLCQRCTQQLVEQEALDTLGHTVDCC